MFFTYRGSMCFICRNTLHIIFFVFSLSENAYLYQSLLIVILNIIIGIIIIHKITHPSIFSRESKYFL